MRPTLKPIAEQVIVITGASSGMGLATARAAASRGAKVMLVARNPASLQAAVDAITAAGGTADYAIADVGVMAQVQHAADATLARFGHIDTWVNAAGVAIYAKILDTPLDEHDRLFRTNYFGTVHSALAAIPCLRDAGGALICVGSLASDIPAPILSAYAASKHAVKGFVNSLRMELLADGIPVSVTLIKPAAIDTPIIPHSSNHAGGEAQMPPPLHHPIVVADAILDAAQHRRREVTVGGLGRLQALLGVHFPALADRLAPKLEAALIDRSRPSTSDSSLFEPRQRGQERSGHHVARRISLYNAAVRHPLRATAILLALAALPLARPRRR